MSAVTTCTKDSFSLFLILLGHPHLPGVLLSVVVHHRPEHHQLYAAALEESHLVLLAQLGEAVDLLGHLDDALDGEFSQVDHTVTHLDEVK